MAHLLGLVHGAIIFWSANVFELVKPGIWDHIRELKLVIAHQNLARGKISGRR